MGVSDRVLQNWIFKFQNFTATMSNIWPKVTKNHVQLALNLILNKPKKPKTGLRVYPIRHYCDAFLMGAIMTTKSRVAVVKWTCNCSFFQIWRGPDTIHTILRYFFLFSSQLIFTIFFNIFATYFNTIFLTKTSSIDHKHVLHYAFLWYIFFSTIKNLRQSFCFIL